MIYINKSVARLDQSNSVIRPINVRDNPQREPRLSPVYRTNYVIQMIDTEFHRVFPRGRNQPFSIDFNYRTHLTEPFYDIWFILRIISVIFFFPTLTAHLLPRHLFLKKFYSCFFFLKSRFFSSARQTPYFVLIWGFLEKIDTRWNGLAGRPKFFFMIFLHVFKASRTLIRET